MISTIFAIHNTLVQQILLKLVMRKIDEKPRWHLFA